MGRGRAKAKQIKVARKLKYNSAPSTDLSALERELHASRGDSYEGYASPDDADDEGEDVDDDPYAAYVDDEPDDDYGSWTAGGSH